MSLCLAGALGLLLPFAGSSHGNITVTSSPPVAGQMTTFKHSSRAFCCRWTFGDGATFGQAFTRNGGDNTARHIYGSLGQYRVTASGHHETTSGRVGKPFSDAITIQVGDSRDPSAPTVELQTSGAIRQTRPHRITGVSASSGVHWSVVARDPDSSMSVLRFLVAFTARCRNVITGSSFTANYGFDSEALPTLLDPRTITHGFSLTLGEMITTASQACKPPFSLAGFVGSVRAEGVNRFGATTKVLRAFSWEPRLKVIAYNLGGGTDVDGHGQRQENYELDDVLPRVAQADIALLQEVREWSCVWFVGRCSRQEKLIRESTPLKYAHWRRGPKKGGLLRRGEFQGPGIFSRYPLRNLRTITDPGGSGRGEATAVIAEATIRGVPHLLISVHYPDSTRDADQAAVGTRINRYIQQFRGPVIVGGDFNSGPGAEGQKPFLSGGAFHSANRGDASYVLYRPTFSSPEPFFPVRTPDPDYVPGGGCELSDPPEPGIDFIYWRGTAPGFGFPNYRHHVYEERCSAVPNSNHPLLMARLR